MQNLYQWYFYISSNYNISIKICTIECKIIKIFMLYVKLMLHKAIYICMYIYLNAMQMHYEKIWYYSIVIFFKYFKSLIFNLFWNYNFIYDTRYNVYLVTINCTLLKQQIWNSSIEQDNSCISRKLLLRITFWMKWKLFQSSDDY